MCPNQTSSLYSYTDLYSIKNVNDELGFIWASKGNDSITWERANTTDLGLEFSIGKYLDVELDYFYKLTDNLLFSRAVTPSLGYSSRPVNDARMVNQGVEFTFNVHAVDMRNVKLDIRLNGSHYSNKMLQMPIDYTNADGTEIRQVMSGAMAEGHSMYDHYTCVFAGVEETSGNALYEAYYDTRYGNLGDPKENNEYNYISSLYQWQHDNPGAEQYLAKTTTADGSMATMQYVGKSYLPDLDGGFGFNLEVYGVTLSASCSYRIGGYGYDYTYMALMAISAVGTRIGYKLLFIERLGIIQRLLCGESEDTVRITLQAGQIIEKRGMLRFLFSIHGFNHGLHALLAFSKHLLRILLILKTPAGYRDAVHTKLHGVKRLRYKGCDLCIPHNDHGQRRCHHTAHIQCLMIQA